MVDQRLFRFCFLSVFGGLLVGAFSGQLLATGLGVVTGMYCFRMLDELHMSMEFAHLLFPTINVIYIIVSGSCCFQAPMAGAWLSRNRGIMCLAQR